MSIWCRWVLVSVLLLSGAPRLAQAASAETRAFLAATQSLTSPFYERAEAEFADFVQKYPGSARLPEAIYCQAEARLKQGKYDGAIELLNAYQSQAGKWTNEFLFWRAEAYSKKGDYPAASDAFAQMLDKFPTSAHALEATVELATVRSKLGDWPRVAELLQRDEGAFQASLRNHITNEWTFSGYLLLGEALLEQRNYPAAEALLRPLVSLAPSAEMAWRRQYLLCRIALADGRREDSLQGTDSLLDLAVHTGHPVLQAESAAFLGGLLEQFGRFNDAIAAYTNNLGRGMPEERQRQALLKITELSLAQTNIGLAITNLEQFRASYPEAPAADLALLTLGELRLRQHEAGTNSNLTVSTNAAVAANDLAQAVAALNELGRRFPQSPLLGKAQFELGWCYWLQTNLPECQAAFQAAIGGGRLPVSNDLAVAYFKLADAQFLQTNYDGAIANYGAIIEKFAGVSQVESNLFERALYQTVRAGLAAMNIPAATNALQKLLAWYPNGFHTDGAVLLAGQTVSQQGNPAAARELYRLFADSTTNAVLLPELPLAIARTYEEETNWTDALEQYDHWLATFTNSALRPRAEYYSAWANFRAGYVTNALNGFSNLVAKFPTDNDYAPFAQMWIADYYFHESTFTDAQRYYQKLFLNTNYHQTNLYYQAQMMAGRAAFAWGGYSDAEGFFTNLTMDAKCPAKLWSEAMFAYGATYMSRSSTNRMADYDFASHIYGAICERYPTNRLALLAKASSQYQYAHFTHQYGEAITNLHLVIESESPRADVATRSEAKVDLGAVLESQARDGTSGDPAKLLAQARDCYLDVLDDKILQEGETRDDFWTLKAGQAVATLLEAQKQWDQEIHIYTVMEGLFPPLRATLDKKILQVQKYKTLQERKSSGP